MLIELKYEQIFLKLVLFDEPADEHNSALSILGLFSAEAAMKDYDVNPGEWDEQGNPKAPQSQLKHMW